MRHGSTSTSEKPAAANFAAYSCLFESAGDAADPQFHAAPDVGRHVAADDDVGDRESAARFQHAEGLAQHGIFVAREIDHAVGDDHVHRVVRQRNGLDRALQELDVRGAGLPLVLPRERQHLVGHVEAVRLAGRADAFGRQQHVDAAARSEIQHRLARFEREQRGRIAAAERRRHGVRRQAARFCVGVEIGGDRDRRSRRPSGRSIRCRSTPCVTDAAMAPYLSRTACWMSDMCSLLVSRKRIYDTYGARDIFVKANIWLSNWWRWKRLFKALADATRLRILGLLLTGEVCVCHIHESLKIPQPKASRHLAYLRRAGLVETRREGLWIHYRLAHARRSGAGRRSARRSPMALTHIDSVQRDADRLQQENRLLRAGARRVGRRAVLRAIAGRP